MQKCKENPQHRAQGRSYTKSGHLRIGEEEVKNWQIIADVFYGLIIL